MFMKILLQSIMLRVVACLRVSHGSSSAGQISLGDGHSGSPLTHDPTGLRAGLPS